MIRPCPRAIIPGNKSRVSSVSATMLICNMSPMRPGSMRSNRPSAPNPALLTRMSMSRPRSAMSCARVTAAPGFERSAGMTVAMAPRARNSAASASIGATRRAVSTRLCPCCASSRASAVPMPLEAPVTSANGRVLRFIKAPFSDTTAARAGTEFQPQPLNGQSDHSQRTERGKSDDEALHYRIAGGCYRRWPRRNRERERGGAAGARPSSRRDGHAGSGGVLLAAADAGHATNAGRSAVAVRHDHATRRRYEIDLQNLRRLGKGGAERSARPVQDRECRAQGGDGHLDRHLHDGAGHCPVRGGGALFRQYDGSQSDDACARRGRAEHENDPAHYRALCRALREVA